MKDMSTAISGKNAMISQSIRTRLVQKGNVAASIALYDQHPVREELVLHLTHS